jgi:hypothetical protein
VADTRTTAREEILREANRARRGHSWRVFYARHLNQAVFRCRQRDLVAPDVLTAAGFHEVRARA